jgi:AbiJ-like protein/uncharacterized protein DUF7014/HEPN domain-containing protein
MAVFDLFSKRKKRDQNAGKADVYCYDAISQTLRVQIAHIWRDALGDYHGYGNHDVVERWKLIHDAIAREKGVFSLGYENSYDEKCVNWFLKANVDDALDFIELSFRAIEILISKLPQYTRDGEGIRVSPEDAIGELNVRFREHGVGYQFENGNVIRIDGQYTHAEVTKPALAILRGAGFETANEDFMAAHRHYRSGENKDCIVACQRSVESALKTVCTLRKWKFEKGDRLPELIKLVRAKNLFPDYLDAGFDTFIAMLKTGLPGIRNNAGGHGAAPADRPVPGYVAAYALHMTATNIVLIAEANRSK